MDDTPFSGNKTAFLGFAWLGQNHRATDPSLETLIQILCDTISHGYIADSDIFKVWERGHREKRKKKAGLAQG